MKLKGKQVLTKDIYTLTLLSLLSRIRAHILQHIFVSENSVMSKYILQ